MRLGAEFFDRDCLEVAPELLGKLIVHRSADGSEVRLRITETEAYRGEEDTACHAHRGRTPRTKLLYGPSGIFYIYLCYGMHWLMNVITGPDGFPQGVLIRACEGSEGPGKLTKKLGVTGKFNSLSAVTCPDLWIEDDGTPVRYTTDRRVGIGYASEEDQAKPWRFKLER